MKKNTSHQLLKTKKWKKICKKPIALTHLLLYLTYHPYLKPLSSRQPHIAILFLNTCKCSSKTGIWKRSRHGIGPTSAMNVSPMISLYPSVNNVALTSKPTKGIMISLQYGRRQILNFVPNRKFLDLKQHKLGSI